MTPNKKANKLVLKFYEMMNVTLEASYAYASVENVDLAAKKSALIAVDEIIQNYEFDSVVINHERIMEDINFWDNVKEEIKKL